MRMRHVMLISIALGDRGGLARGGLRFLFPGLGLDPRSNSIPVPELRLLDKGQDPTMTIIGLSRCKIIVNVQ